MLTFDSYKLLVRRKELGYTKDKAASLAYCQTKAYDEWERGVNTPSDWWLERIAKALDCKPEDLCSHKQKRPLRAATLRRQYQKSRSHDSTLILK